MMDRNGQGGSGFGGLIAWGLGLWVGTRLIEGATGRSIWDQLGEYAEASAARQREIEKERQRQRVWEFLAELPAIPPSPTRPWGGLLLPGLAAQPAAASPPVMASLSISPLPTQPDAAWRQKVVHPSVVLVLGKRGSGKSALGYRLLELFRYTAAPYVVGVPNAARRLLPDWIGIASSLDKVPTKSIALLDEAYLPFHSRASNTAEARAMSQLLNLSRQREQTLVFVSQEARQVDRNIASSATAVVFKDLGMLQLEFDRQELGKLAAQAKQALVGVQGDKRRWSFVYAPDADFLGLLKNELPSFWAPSLSRLFAGGSAPAPSRAAKAVTPQEKAAKAKAMRAQGASLRTIADALGVTRSTVVNYLKGYPYSEKRGAQG